MGLVIDQSDIPLEDVLTAFNASNFVKRAFYRSKFIVREFLYFEDLVVRLSIYPA